MKKNIAIVAGGDSSEIVISLKSAEGIYSFIDKDKYNLYIAIVKKDEWSVRLPNGEHTPIDKMISASLKMVKINALILLISPSMELRARTDDYKVIST